MSRRIPNCLLVFTLFFWLSCHSKSGQKITLFNKKDLISGTVTGIIDGDTYDLLISENRTIRIRMTGIDAPERGMPYYQVSRRYLGELCFHKTVKIRTTGDDGNRVLAFTYLEDGRELGNEMVRAGLAWHFKKYSSDKNLAALEMEARIARRGLWKDKDPMPPWIYRKMHREGISTKHLFHDPGNR